jgi:Zn-finger protein
MSEGEKRYSFFQNKPCEYFPCHKTDSPETFNCLFCYCPLYALDELCGGDFRRAKNGVKDCSACMHPHEKENYGKVIARFSEITEMMKRNRRIRNLEDSKE